MILKSIRLHPFAGIADKTYSFKDSLTVICGPNEEGKSTVAKAINQILFLQTDLTPAKKEAALKDVKPNAGGDTVRITLNFIYDGLEYTLLKQWGPTSSVELKNTNGILLTDNNSVQQKITEMLPANQAVVEQVLIANQSKLADAVDKLSPDVHASVSDQLRGAILKSGGISASALKTRIDEILREYFGRWDEISNTIEGGASRGIYNPWKSGVKKIAAAWYEWQKAIDQAEEIKQYETESNRLQNLLNDCNEKLKATTEFIQNNKAAYDAVTQRIFLESEIGQYKRKLQELAQNAQRWRDAVAELKTETKACDTLREEVEQLKDELENSRKKQNAKSDIEKLKQIKKLQQELAKAEITLGALNEISDDDLNNAGKFQREITRLQAQIDGQKLRLNIDPLVNGSLQLTHSGGKTESLNFTAAEVIEKQISGSVSFEWQGVTFSIQSGNIDIKQLEKSLNVAQECLNELLEKYSQDSLESLTEADKQYSEVANQVKQLNSNIQAALGTSTLDALEQRCKEAEVLPATRDIKLLEPLYTEKNQTLGQLNKKLQDLNNEVQQFETKYETFDKLDDLRLETKKIIAEKQNYLNKLPPLPEGFETAIAFQETYNKKVDESISLTEEKHKIELQLNDLSSNEPELTLAEAQDQTLLDKSKFDTALAVGKAFRRIEKTLNHLLAHADTYAFKPLHERAEFYLKNLSSGRFKSIPFDATQPQRLTTDSVSLPVHLLSKGTKDILALSLRLAAADVYLKNNTGFVMMDDPLVDMDKNRRQAAASVLAQFAEEHQTIIFTCHEHHEALLHTQADQAMDVISQASAS